MFILKVFLAYYDMGRGEIMGCRANDGRFKMAAADLVNYRKKANEGKNSGNGIL
jgi:hypothetical protein